MIWFSAVFVCIYIHVDLGMHIYVTHFSLVKKVSGVVQPRKQSVVCWRMVWLVGQPSVQDKAGIYESSTYVQDKAEIY